MKTRIFGIGACLALAASLAAQTKQPIRVAQAWTYDDYKLVSIRKEVDASHRLYLDQVSDKEALSKLANAWQRFQANKSVPSAYRFLYLCCHFRKSSFHHGDEILSVFNAYPTLPSYEWERVRSCIEAFEPYLDSQASRKIILRLLKREPEDTLNMESFIAIAPLLTLSELDQATLMVEKLITRYPRVVNYYHQLAAIVLSNKADKSLSKSNYDLAIKAYEKLRDEKAMPQKQADIAINSLKHAVEWLRSKGKLKP